MWHAIAWSLFLSSVVLAQTPEMSGRTGATKDKLLRMNGGNAASEAAIARGLGWLGRQQQEDGSWKSDGKSEDRVAATCFGVLPFMGAGETHKSKGSKYNATVTKALQWLTKNQNKDGSFVGADVQGHALATLTLCEAYGMTSDPMLKAHSDAAVAFLVKAQGKNGSWGLKPGDNGAIATTYWAVQALHTASLAQVKFDRDTVVKKVDTYLESVTVDKFKFGNAKSKDLPTTTAQAMWCRYLIGTYNPKHPKFGHGIDYLRTQPPTPEVFDVDYFFAATLSFHGYDGPEWHKFWNPKMRDLLTEAQNNKGNESTRGSWGKSAGAITEYYGAVGTTSMALLTLQVYYRYLPIYKRDPDGMKDLDR